MIEKAIGILDKKLLFLRLLLATLILLDLLYAKLYFPQSTSEFDLFELRFLVSILLAANFAASYFFDYKNKVFYLFTYCCLLINTAFDLYLLYVHKFHFVNVSEFVFTLLITSLLFLKIRYVGFYLSVVFAIIFCFNISLDPEFSELVSRSIFIGLFSCIVFVFCSLKLFFENKFLQRGNLLKYLYHESRESIILADPKLNAVKFINSIGKSILKINSKDALSEMPFDKLLESCGIELKIKDIENEIRSNGSFQQNIKFIKEDGELFSGSVHIELIPEDGKILWLIRFVDLTEQFNTNRKLKENQETFVRLLDAIPHKIFLKDPQSKFLVVNKTVEQTHSQDKEFFIGKTDYDLFPSEKAQAFLDQEKDVIQNLKTISFTEEKVVMADGSERMFQITKMPFFLPEYKKYGLFGLGIDITQINNYQDKLRKSEASYRTLMEQASDGIYSADKFGIITDANPKACHMLGYSKGELVGFNVKSLTDEKDDRIFNVESVDFSEKKSLIVERKFKKRDGSIFIVELSVTILHDGGHQGIMRDITERKRMEKIVLDNEKKFRALIDSSYDITAILDENLIVNFISPSVLKILGYLPKKIENRTPFDLIHPEDKAPTELFLRDLLTSPKEFKILKEIRMRAFQGAYKYFEVAGNNLVGDQAINGLVINLHDITERKNSETQLLNTNFELDSFVYRVSHDIKAPLRSVMGLIGIAKLENKQPEINSYLDMMNKSVLNLDYFIKDLTLFSRNSRMELEFNKIDFEKLVSECIENLKFMDNVEKVEIRKNIKEKIFFYSDITRITTIISNLLSNSLKYHKFEQNKSFVNIVIRDENNQLVIEVEDNGVGINPTYQDKIFDMFFRASEKSYGSGLGLYIVKTAVNKLKGKITVHSVPDEGTTFKVVLPRLTVTNNG
ncbi:MAG: PAS domain-containing sensor histidine kinase [Opitutaceae bacterium]|nr:PAS domain-containing sensor histidine kinase [Cytophagales bacterium]